MDWSERLAHLIGPVTLSGRTGLPPVTISS